MAIIPIQMAIIPIQMAIMPIYMAIIPIQMALITYRPYQQSTYIITQNIVIDLNSGLLYMNIDQIFPNELHGQTHCIIGVTCVCNGHVFYTLL